MKLIPAIPQDRPIVDAMRCSIPDDAEIWAKHERPANPVIPLDKGGFMASFRKHGKAKIWLPK